MSITLVGVFDSEGEAQQASSRLQSAGIDKQAIRVEPELGGGGGAPVEDEDRRGFFAKLFGLGDDDTSTHYGEAVKRGHSVVTVSLSDEQRSDEVSDILEDCGAVDVDERVEQWKAGGYLPAPAARSETDGSGETLQAVEEELQVGKRVVQRGRVRIHRRVSERPVEEQVSLHEERASIERQKVDRPASEGDLQAAFRDEDIEIRETAEEPVVSKTARVVEEVRIGKKGSQRSETVRDTVRSSRIDVENDAARQGTMPAYAGPERRLPSRGSYAGTERRAAS